MNVSFKANCVLQTTIKELTKNKPPVDRNVSFIEINPFGADDMTCLYETAVQWRGSQFASTIFQDAYIDRYLNENGKRINKYYALTEQMSNFKQPKHDKILGLLEIELISQSLEFIRFLQVNPAFMWKTQNSKYKHIGSSILDAIKKLCPNKDLLLDPAVGTKQFYIKNGFKQLEGSSTMIFPKCNN